MKVTSDLPQMQNRMQNHSHLQTNSHSKLLLFSDSLLVVYNKCNITSTKYTLLKINTTTSIYIFGYPGETLALVVQILLQKLIIHEEKQGTMSVILL